MSGRRKGRGRGRGRGRGSVISRAVRTVENRDKWRFFVPPVRQPTINRSFIFSFTTLLGEEVTTSKNILYRTENVVTAVAETVAMTSSWYPLIRIRVQSFSAYAIVSKIDTDIVPTMTVVVYDPITGVMVKQEAMFGDLDDPARGGMHYPSAVREHPLAWDGIEGTSAGLVGVRVPQACVISTYWNLVVYIDKAFVPTEWSKPTPRFPRGELADIEDRLRNIELGEMGQGKDLLTVDQVETRRLEEWCTPAIDDED